MCKECFSLKAAEVGSYSSLFKIEYVGTEGLVAFVPNGQSSSQDSNLFQNMIYRASLMKLIAYRQFIPDVKEELILLNPQQDKVVGYCLILEGYTHSLSDLINIWRDPTEA